MERKKASDFPQELLNLFDLYVHGDIERREFFEGAKKFATGGVTVTALWESLRPNYAFAEQVPKDDKRLKTEYVTVDSPQGNGSIKGYLVRPSSGTKWPAVIVIHENRGLNPYIEDVARRLGTNGFMAFAPDGLTSVGGYPKEGEEVAAKMFGTVDQGKMRQDFIASAHWLKARPDCTGKLGAVGFCFGGGIVNFLAVQLGSDLSAGVPFYGAQPNAADTAKIKSPLLIHYAGLDERIDSGWPAWEQALKANNVKYEEFTYAGANHGFHNDTTPRYDEAAAKQAWQRTLDFFNKNLKTTS